MSSKIYYEFGQTDGKTPLEKFYEAMLPLLENYGLTAEFPADKPSLEYSVSGIEFSVLIGEPPAAIRYIKWQESPYSSGGIELTLESETLVHIETGEKLYFKIFITDYISGMNKDPTTLWLSVKFSGAESEVEAFKNAVSTVLAKYGFRSHAVQNSTVAGDPYNNLSVNSNDNLKSELMTNNNINFDELAQKAFAPGAGEADYEKLFAAAFSLPEWHFIADGEMSNLSPHCALFPDFFGDQPAVAVFTDTERARKFMAESNTEFGSNDKSINLDYGNPTATISSEDLILSVPTTNILDYIEKLIPKGVVKIFFNPDKDSHGFSNDLKIMRPIREHLESKNLLPKNADKTTFEDAPQTSVKTLIVQIKDGLGFPSGFVKAAEDTMHLFCRVPPNWVDGEQLKPAYLEKIYAQFYGANWRMGNSDGSHYKILDSYTKIFTPETVKTTKFGGTVNQDKHQFFFYIADKYDAIRKVTAEEFQADIDAERQPEKPGQLTKLLEENAEIINDFERENATFSAMMAGGAAALDENSDEEKEQVISNMADMFESVRAENNMSPELFRIFIESCLKERKFLMPVLAFAYFQQDKAKMERLEQDKELFDEFTNWLMRKISPDADLLINKAEQESAALSEKESDKPTDDSKDGATIAETSTAPFDELSRKATQTKAMEDLNALFGAAFALSEWQFISRGELPNVYPYVASNAQYASNQPMIRAFTDSKRLQRFARENNLTDADDSCDILTIPTANIIEYLEGFISQGAYGVWFNSDTESDGFFIPLKQLRPIKEHLAKLNQPEKSNLQNWGLAESPDGEIDLNLNINKVGAVGFETSIAPFYEAILPLLTDYKGAGEYVTLLRFEDIGKSEQVENIAENAHGAYLQIRRFLYLNPKNNVRIGVNSIHSNSLRHVQTNSELLVSFELCKNLDNQTAAFYHAFQGPKSEILKLLAAIQPILESVGYKAVQ